jgi:hypothetical protein
MYNYDEDFFGDVDYNFEDCKELLIEDHVRELEYAQEITVTLTLRELEDLSYACAHAEMMWRKRSHNPSIDHHGSHGEPEEFEKTCRAEMKKYRLLQRKVNYRFD